MECNKLIFFLIALLFWFNTIGQNPAKSFEISGKGGICTIVYDSTDFSTVKKAAELLAGDIEMISGKRPKIQSNPENLSGNVIIVGSLKMSGLIKNFAKNKLIDTSAISGKWETFSISLIKNPAKYVKQALVVCGSDRRGTAYGIFHISEMMGVNPWYWWADVNPGKRDNISIKVSNYTSKEPSVKYRGIFLNDEDWGLQPWAAKTFEPETGDIGPKTYAKIFELLLRLKANTVWPAMHDCTKAFYHYPANRLVADTFGIIVGSSHAEPMMRNNVDEWDKSSMGEYNYKVNRQGVYNYWKQRAIESRDFENIYTLGMRGIHDSGIEGMNSIGEKVQFLEKIIADQREILREAHQKSVDEIPQVFTIYKEVLDIYDNGLKIPEDVSIIWPDDNYGYIQRLNSAEEMKRTGGSGVYYHASYWGRPHDYLWLGTTNPMLVYEEMMEAYHYKADRIWILNVGDIKPAEYIIQFFLDLAWDKEDFKQPEFVKKHLNDWITAIFDNEHATDIASVLWEYYNLAFERRPEFMGWSQVEPITNTQNTGYNHFYFGDQAQNRMIRYDKIMNRVRNMYSEVKKRDAFYQLVYYPVICAGLMNKKVFNLEKAYLYSKQNRTSANDFSQMAKMACDSIVAETNYFNNVLMGGKWKYMMSMHPRDLPVFEKPLFPKWDIPEIKQIAISVEGDQELRSSPEIYGPSELPVFYSQLPQEHFFDIFMKGNLAVDWQAKVSGDWIKLSKYSGKLESTFNKKQERIFVSINANMISESPESNGTIEIVAGDQKFLLKVKAINLKLPLDFSGFIEDNGYVSIYAADYNRQKRLGNLKWVKVSIPGYTEKMMKVVPEDSILQNFDLKPTELPYLEYDLFLNEKTDITVQVFGLPVHPRRKDDKLRFFVSLNEDEPEPADFTTYGRSEEWKQNVLSNNAVKTFRFKANAGKNTLRVYGMDPGVFIDRVVIFIGKEIQNYGLLPETKVAGELK